MARPFIPVDGQAGLDQTANELHVRNGRRKEGDVQRERERDKTHMTTHTRTQREDRIFPAESIVGANDSMY